METEPDRPGVRRLWLVGTVAAIAIGTLFAAQTIGLNLARDQPAEVLRVFGVQALPWLAWAVLLPIIYRMCERWPIRDGAWRPTWWRYLGVAFLAAPALTALITYPMGALRPMYVGDSLLQSWMFVLLNYGPASLVQFSLVVFACHIVLAFREVRERERRESRLARQLAEAELRSLKMQIQPHFLFNTLNAIAAHLRDSPDVAERMLESLSDLLRLVLDSSSDNEVTLEHELEIARHYLGIHEVRFGGRLSVRIDVPPYLAGAMIPPLLLQPLVENAVVHGVGSRVGSGQIELRGSRRGDRLRIEIENRQQAGPRAMPSKSQEGHGIGLANVRDRLRQLYGADHSLELDMVPGLRGRVVIEMPFRVGAPGRPR